MSEKPSRRFRFRLSARETKTLPKLLAATSHRSKSSVIRSALSLLRQVKCAEAEGFRVFYQQARSGRERTSDQLAAMVAPGDAEERADKGLGAGFLELRLTPTDVEELEDIQALGAASTGSEAVRRAIHFYAEAVKNVREGYGLRGESPAGQTITFTVHGLPGQSKARRGIPTAAPRPQAAATPSAGPTPTMLDLFPDTLAEAVAEAAKQAGHDPRAFIVDLIERAVAHVPREQAEYPASLRPHKEEPPEVLLEEQAKEQEAARDLHAEDAPEAKEPEALTGEPVADETSQEEVPEAPQVEAEPPSAPPESEPAPLSEPGEHDQPHQEEPLEILLEEQAKEQEAARELLAEDTPGAEAPEALAEEEPMAGETVQDEDSEAAVAEAEPPSAPPQPEPPTPTKRRAKDTSEQLDLFGMEEISAPPSGEGSGATDGWALVVAQDEEGRPQERVVQPDTVIPMDVTDLVAFKDQEEAE